MAPVAWLADRKYRVLFPAVIALVTLQPVLRSAVWTRVLIDVLFSAVFLIVIFGLVAEHRLRAVGVLFGVPTLVGLWTGYALPDLPQVPLTLVLHSFAAAFMAFTIGVILWHLHHETGVSADSVYGAFCGYLLAGLMFGHLYCLLEILHPGSFRGDGFVNPTPDSQHFLLTYFSFLTLTTVGYGDITPGTDTARGLVVAEAIVGQFYIAVLVAELIGKRVGQAAALPVPDGRRDESPSS